MSTYIVSQKPFRYGGLQEDYLAQVAGVVSETAGKFRQARNENADLIDLFHRTLADLGAARLRIAQEHGTEQGELFGVRRDFAESFIEPGITPMGGVYSTYNKRLVNLFTDYLDHLRQTQEGFPEIELVINEGDYETRASRAEFILLSDTALEQLAIPETFEEYQRFCEMCSLPCSEPRSVTFSDFAALLTNRGAMQALRSCSIGDYNTLRLISALFFLRSSFSGITDWLLVTRYLDVADQLHQISEYLIGFNDQAPKDTLQCMRENAITVILHQDAFLVDSMLADVAHLFKEALEWDGSDPKMLKGRVALLQYELAHAMPFKRGTAAISEWLEMALYRHHGFNLIYNPEKNVNLEALTSPLSQFMEGYDSMLTIQPLPL